jgi:predicted metal-binding protein
MEATHGLSGGSNDIDIRTSQPHIRAGQTTKGTVCRGACEDGLSVIAEKLLKLAYVLNGRVMNMSASELLQPVIRNAYLGSYCFIVAAIVGLFL